MAETDEILSQYVSMRSSGLDTGDVLDTLRSYIRPLSKTSRLRLAQAIREWEDYQQPSDDKPQAQSSKRTGAGSSPKTEPANWLVCPHCNEKNRIDAVFCYACGLILDVTQVGTRHFTDRLVLVDEYFGPDSVLVLKVSDADLEYEMRPQASSKGIYIGRRTAQSTVTPDFDLNEAGADRRGVSRLHMAVKFDSVSETLQVYDLGSKNGTYINGQLLHPREVRVLRSGDEITLGHLVMRAEFHHPGDELD